MFSCRTSDSKASSSRPAKSKHMGMYLWPSTRRAFATSGASSRNVVTFGWRTKNRK
jgi:hypothetical protein